MKNYSKSLFVFQTFCKSRIILVFVHSLWADNALNFLVYHLCIKCIIMRLNFGVYSPNLSSFHSKIEWGSRIWESPLASGNTNFINWHEYTQTLLGLVIWLTGCLLIFLRIRYYILFLYQTWFIFFYLLEFKILGCICFIHDHSANQTKMVLKL